MKPLDPTPYLEAPPKPATNGRLLHYAKKVREATLAELESLPAGRDLGAGRNDRYFQLCATLANFLGDPWHAWSAEDIRALCAPIATARQIPGWQATLESAIRTGEASPRTVPAELEASLNLEREATLRNYEIRQSATTGRDYKARLPSDAMARRVYDAAGDWPRVVGESQLFVPDSDRVWRLDSPAELFAWLDTQVAIDWNSNARLVSKTELLAALRAHAPVRYDATEQLPHYPPIEGVYYLRTIQDANCGALGAFARLFNPASELDRLLIVAALVTPYWGGPAGSRPAFVFTSEHGRGAGKTATAQAICAVYGGEISIAPRKIDWKRVIDRLLSPAALDRRCVLVDNLKGRLDCPEIESAITSASIGGRAMYIGEARRPNILTWFFTANSPSLSTDLAARSVVIRIGEPKHGVCFAELVREFLDRHREALLGEIQRLLKSPNQGRCAPDRFQAWQQGVLCKSAQAARLQALIEDRRGETDDETAEIADVRAAIVKWISSQQRPTNWQGLISSHECLQALRWLWPDVSSVRALWARLDPLVGNGELRKCKRIRCGRDAKKWGGNGLLWR